MPRKSPFSHLTVEIPKGCDVDRKRLYVYYRKNTIRRPYKDRPGTYPDHERVCVGKAVPPESPSEKFRWMVPNANFPEVWFGILKAGGDSEEEAAAKVREKFGSFSFPEEESHRDHVSLGVYLAFQAVAENCGLMTDLAIAFGEEDALLVLDLAQYLLSAKSAAFSHLPHWAKRHRLFSDSVPETGELDKRFTQDKIDHFRRLWADRVGEGRFILCADSPDGDYESGVALGRGREKDDLVITRYVIRESDGIPVTWREYPGSFNDVMEVVKMQEFLRGLSGEVICDRGCISKRDLGKMIQEGCNFLLVLRPDAGIAEEILSENLDRLLSPENFVPEHGIYALTVEGSLFPGNTCFFHLIREETLQRDRLHLVLEKMEEDLQSLIENQTALTEREFRKYQRYFTLGLETVSGRRGPAYRIISAVRDEERIMRFGCRVLVTSEPMEAVLAYRRYHRKDDMESIFSVLHSRYGMDEDESRRGQALAWFVASTVCSLIREKTASLRPFDLIDCLEEYEANSRYGLTPGQEQVFAALGIEDGDIPAALKRL